MHLPRKASSKTPAVYFSSALHTQCSAGSADSAAEKRKNGARATSMALFNIVWNDPQLPGLSSAAGLLRHDMQRARQPASQLQGKKPGRLRQLLRATNVWLSRNPTTSAYIDTAGGCRPCTAQPAANFRGMLPHTSLSPALCGLFTRCQCIDQRVSRGPLG